MQELLEVEVLNVFRQPRIFRLNKQIQKFQVNLFLIATIDLFALESSCLHLTARLSLHSAKRQGVLEPSKLAKS